MKICERQKRNSSLSRFGFGAEVMKNTVVCTRCNSPENGEKIFCSKCGTRLPRETLYDYYRARHRSCPVCESVLSDSMDFCPKCGSPVRKVRDL